MKILITHELFAPDFAGGGEYVALETARSLRSRGHEVRVLTTGNPDIAEYEGIPTVRLPIHRYRFNLAVGTILQFAREADVIQTFNYNACLPSLLAGKLAHKPVVCTILGLFGNAWKDMRPGILGDLWMAWERFLLTRRYARTIFLSEYSRQQGLGLGVPALRALVNSPGIELDLYTPRFPKEDVVFFTGKLDVRKGIYEVLEVARALPEVKFRVMGWGPEEALFRSTATPNVEFLAFDRDAPLREAFSSARIFISPTKAETFGIAVVQAMASGCAIISTVPLDYEGVRISADDIPAMIDAVRLLWNDRQKTTEMGKRNTELAQQYTWDRNTTKLLATYHQVIKEWQR